jgi:hypothetical protein
VQLVVKSDGFECRQYWYNWTRTDEYWVLIVAVAPWGLSMLVQLFLYSYRSREAQLGRQGEHVERRGSHWKYIEHLIQSEEFNTAI